MIKWTLLTEIRGDGSRSSIMINAHQIVDVKERNYGFDGEKVTVILYANGESVQVEESLSIVFSMLNGFRNK